MTRRAGNAARHAFDRLDAWMIGSMAKYGIGVLRVALGVVFVWFGLLKVITYTVVVNLGQLVLWMMSFYLVLVMAEAWELAQESRTSRPPEA